jgi:hypothetical protein
MAGISLSMSRGVSGTKISDITVGTAVPGTGDIELRYNTLDTNSHALTRKDVILACKAFIRAMEEGQLITTTPVL